MTESEANKVIAMIAAHKPVPELPFETMKLWAKLIIDLDFDAAEAAADGVEARLAALLWSGDAA